MDRGEAATIAGRGEQGTSLLEVVISLLLLLILMVSVLQLFAMSFMVNGSAGARTEMTERAQQVVEQIRFLQELKREDPSAYGTLDAATPVGFPIPLPAGRTYSITDLVIENPAGSYWGPAGCRIVDRPASEEGRRLGAVRPSYVMTVTTAMGQKGSVVVTVRARANPKRGRPLHDPRYGTFLGAGMDRKAVEYVAQLNP